MTAKKEGLSISVSQIIGSLVIAAIIGLFGYVLSSGNVNATTGVEIKELKIDVDKKLDKETFIAYKSSFDKFIETQKETNKALTDFIVELKTKKQIK